MKIFDKNKLEELLIANWTKFLDFSKFMAIVLEKVRDNENKFNKIPNKTQIKSQNFQIMMSRFEIIENGFVLWVEFKVPINNGLAIGTSEFHLNNNGNLTHKETLGNIYFQEN